MKRLDVAAKMDNVVFTNFMIERRQDIIDALEGSGYEIDPHCRVQYIDNGALATFWAVDDETGIPQPWMAINWSAFQECDKSTWLKHWSRL